MECSRGIAMGILSVCLSVYLSDCPSVRPSVKRLHCSGHFEGEWRGNAVPIVKINLKRMGTAFPLLSYGENAYIRLKMHFAVQKDVFLTLKYGKTRWRPGLRPGPRWGSLRRSPRPPSRLGRRHPSPDPTSLSAFGASILAPSAPRIRRSILAFPALERNRRF